MVFLAGEFAYKVRKPVALGFLDFSMLDRRRHCADEEVRLTKRNYGWPEDAKFLVPDGVYERFAEGVGKRGSQARHSWMELFERYRAQYPDLAGEIDLMQRRELPSGWDRNLPVFQADP